jgi:tetratricopeptide (TPR) repeat protein
VPCYKRALAINAGHVKAEYNLGCALRALGDVDEALVRYRKALALQPNYVEAGFRESLAELLQAISPLAGNIMKGAGITKSTARPCDAINSRFGLATSCPSPSIDLG